METPQPGPKAGMQIGAMASFTEDQGMKKPLSSQFHPRCFFIKTWQVGGFNPAGRGFK